MRARVAGKVVRRHVKERRFYRQSTYRVAARRWSQLLVSGCRRAGRYFGGRADQIWVAAGWTSYGMDIVSAYPVGQPDKVSPKRTAQTAHRVDNPTK